MGMALPILRLILLLLGLFGFLKAHEGHLGTPNQHLLVCMCRPKWYLPISSYLWLKPLRSSGYTNI
jgi:hypothetical protein